MSTLIAVPSAAGTILIEADHASFAGAVTRGGAGGTIEKATTSFEEGWARLKPVASQIVEQLAASVAGTDTVKVTFGVKFSADAGVFIASASSEANFAVEITWKRPPA